jgi:hypothetical protein
MHTLSSLFNAGVTALAAALPSRPSALTALNLGECRMGAAGCSALAAALRELPAAPEGSSKCSLVLGPRNGLEDADVAAVADALTHRASAVGSSNLDFDLDLAGADLDGTAVAALAKVPGFQSLVLFGSSLSPAAMTALNEALSGRGRAGGPFAALREINLCGCRLELEVLMQLLKALEAGGAPEGGDDKLRLIEVRAELPFRTRRLAVDRSTTDCMVHRPLHSPHPLASAVIQIGGGQPWIRRGRLPGGGRRTQGADARTRRPLARGRRQQRGRRAAGRRAGGNAAAAAVRLGLAVRF